MSKGLNRLDYCKGAHSFRKYFARAVVLVILCNLAVIGYHNVKKSEAATVNQVNVTVDYLEETATVSVGTGSSIKFYMSTDNMKTWDILEPTNVVDISGFLQTKAVNLYFKGNKDTTPTQVILQAEDNSLKASYQIFSGTGRVMFDTSLGPVEYRKGSNGQWRTAINLMPTSAYEMKGATLYFRTAATVSKRAGKIVTVRIPKKPSAPSVKLDGGKFTITGLKNGDTQYRFGDSSVWLTFKPADEKIKTLDVAALLSPGATANTPIPAGVIEFRSMGTDKRLYSASKILEIPAQVSVPDTVHLTGSTLTITDSDNKLAYEYSVVASGSTLNIATAKWTTVYSAKNYIIPKVSVGDKIYVRVKSSIDKTTKQTLLASTYKELMITTISPSTK